MRASKLTFKYQDTYREKITRLPATPPCPIERICAIRGCVHVAHGCSIKVHYRSFSCIIGVALSRVFLGKLEFRNQSHLGTYQDQKGDNLFGCTVQPRPDYTDRGNPLD